MSEDSRKDAHRFRPPSPREQYESIDLRLRSERRTALTAVGRLLRDTPREEWGQLSGHADLQTCGALECLGNTVADTLTQDALYAHRVAELAVSVAEATAIDTYPPVIAAQIRGHAWKDLGKTLRCLGRYEESIAALSRAETEVAQYLTLAYDTSIVRFNLAMTLQEVNRYDESLRLLAECKEVFRQHADTNLVVLCSLGEGVLFQRLGKYREAREIYLLLVASRSDIAKESLAALHHAIGFCSVDLGDYAEAEANLLRSISLHRELGQTLQVLKGETGRGRLFLRRGDFALAVSHLRPLRREFLRKSLAEEAGLCGLEVVEALLMLGRAAEAENLARKIVHEFVTAALSTRAVAALGYLTEAISAKRASAKTARDVREYVISLRTTPERDFHLL